MTSFKSPASTANIFRNLTSVGLITFNATAFFEVLAPAHGLASIKASKRKHKTWKNSMREAFQEAHNINFGTVFRLGKTILDTLPPSPIVEAALKEIYQAMNLWYHMVDF